jgi:hypothetical protein
MQFTIVECDGCGKRAEYANDGSIKASSSITQENKNFLSMRGLLGSNEFNICSPECATNAINKKFDISKKKRKVNL